MTKLKKEKECVDVLKLNGNEMSSHNASDV